jgi:integrase
MAVLAECPVCHKKQSVRNKICKCGLDLNGAKKSKKVNYWISYRTPERRQRFEKIKGKEQHSIEFAKDVLSKREIQKIEDPKYFDIKPNVVLTFQKLTDWFIDHPRVKSLAYYPTLKFLLNNFNKDFGNRIAGNLKLSDLERYQVKRKAEGKSDYTIDQEIGSVKTMLNKAILDDMIDANVLKPFLKLNKLLKKGANVRDRALTKEEYDKLYEFSLPHIKPLVAMGYYTGMREAEITGLTWDRLHLSERYILLRAMDTKTDIPRKVPICDDLYEILNKIPVPITREGYVFLYHGRRSKNFRKSLREACNKAGIPYGRFITGGFVFHDLRHTFITNMRKAGVHDSVTMRISGHSTREMFDRYNRVDVDDMRKGISQFEGYLRKPVENVYQTVYQVPK